MRHLILGAGNMGKRHAYILRSLGDICVFRDIKPGWNRFNIEKDIPCSDSVLICSSPETHEKLIKQIAPYGSPLFVEKPVAVRKTKLTYPGISMVACNWRWCSCLPKKISSIIALYPHNQYSKLDYIHFVDLFWRKKMHIKTGKYKNKFCLIINNKLVDLIDSTLAVTYVNDKRIHSTPCWMFTEQMRHWRECVLNHEQSCNPIEMASDRTNFLISAFKNRETIRDIIRV